MSTPPDPIERYGAAAPTIQTILATARPEIRPPHQPTEHSSEPPDPDTWVTVLRAVEQERISGLLWAAIEAGFVVTPVQRAEAGQLHHDSMTMLVRLEATAAWVVGLLSAAGIDVRVIKGLATGQLVHPEVEHRDSGDVDLLVPPAQFAAAIQSLEEAGVAREGSWGRDTDVFAKEVVFRAGDIEIDLHQSLAYGGRWRRATPDLIDGGLELPRSTGGHPARTLSLEGLFVSACVSAVGSDARLTGLLDIAAISHHPDLDRDRLRDLVTAIGCAPLLVPVIDRAASVFSVDPEVAVTIEAAPATTADQIRTGLETADGGIRFLYSCLTGHPRTWARGIRTLVIPDDAHFEADGRTSTDNWRRIWARGTELLRLPLPSHH